MPEYRILVLGTAGVGKSALTVQFVNGFFVDIYNPTVEDSYRKQVTIDDQCYVLDILDTAGVEDFSAVRQHYTLSGHGFIIVYSITSKASFAEVEVIHKDILRIKDSDKLPIVVAGNKCDLNQLRQVTVSECEEYCAPYNIPCIEVSAKGKINVEEVFHRAVKEVIKYELENNPRPIISPKVKKSRTCMVM